MAATAVRTSEDVRAETVPIAWPSAVAMLLAPLGIVVASLAIPAGVDELPTSDEKVAAILDIVARHPFGTRLGFLAFAAGMLLLLEALAVLRGLAAREPRGRALIQTGAWLAAIAAGALAIGNAFAPASEPSAVLHDLPRDVMIRYMRHHLLNGWDWAIIAFYPLLPIGAVLLGSGLWRSRVVSRAAALLIAVPLLALIALPLSLPTLPLGLALEAGFILVVRQEWRRAGR